MSNKKYDDYVDMSIDDINEHIDMLETILTIKQDRGKRITIYNVCYGERIDDSIIMSEYGFKYKAKALQDVSLFIKKAEDIAYFNMYEDYLYEDEYKDKDDWWLISKEVDTKQ